jgi:flagellar biosynthetic protein FliQ
MTPEFAIETLRHALLTAFCLAAPLLVVGFLVGIAMSLIQILTSIQDTSFSAVPRLLAFMTAFVVAMPWMLQRITAYAVSIFGDLSRYGR